MLKYGFFNPLLFLQKSNSCIAKNSKKSCRFTIYQSLKRQSIYFFNAEDGTWTHTSAMLTRSLVLLVCQFRHFRIPYRIYDLFADHKWYDTIIQTKSQHFFITFCQFFSSFYLRFITSLIFHFFQKINSDNHHKCQKAHSGIASSHHLNKKRKSSIKDFLLFL